MTIEQINQIRQHLIWKGFTEIQIADFIESLPGEVHIVNYENKAGDSMRQFVSAVVKEPAIVNLLNTLANKEEKLTELDNSERKDFYGFLTRLDLRQKVYNGGIIIIGCTIVTLLKYFDVVGKESAQTLATVIISASLTDAISSFFKSKDRD
jgi:hypothetical protein